MTIQDIEQLWYEFIDLIESDPDFNYDRSEFTDWVMDVVISI